MGVGFWVLDFGFLVWGFGVWVLGFGFWVLGFGGSGGSRGPGGPLEAGPNGGLGPAGSAESTKGPPEEPLETTGGPWRPLCGGPTQKYYPLCWLSLWLVKTKLLDPPPNLC